MQLEAQENERLRREGSAEIERLTRHITELTRAHTTVEAENAGRQHRLQQLEAERTAMQQTHERLGQQQSQQEAILHTLKQQVSELSQARHADQERAAALKRELEAWQRRYEAQEAATAELETALESVRRYEPESLRHAHAHLETVKQAYEEKLGALEAAAAAKYSKLLRASQQHQAEATATVQQLESDFLREKNRVVEQLRHEIDQLQHANEALQREVASKSEEISRLVASQQQPARQQQADAERLQEAKALRLRDELDKSLAENDELRRELAEKKELHEEDLRIQLSAFETQYHDYSEQATRQISDVTSERDHLDAELQQERQRVQELTAELTAEAASKAQDASEFHAREATQRQTIRALYTEKEEMTRNVAALAAEKATSEREREQLEVAMARVDADKRALETKLHDLMKEATETLQNHQQHATLSTQDARAQVEKLSTDLRHRDEQIQRGQQQLRELQSRGRQLERDLETANSWNARLRADVETLQRDKRALESGRAAEQTASGRDHQRALDELTARYEQAKNELWSRVVEEESKTNELCAQLSAEDEYHQTQLQAAHTALEQVQERHRELEHENQVMSSEMSTQRSILEEASRLEARHHELVQVHEQLKSEMAALSADSATTIAELEEHAANLQSALEREQQLQSKSKGGLAHQHAEHAKALHALRLHVRELEQANSQLKRQVQTTDEQRVATEQSRVHEKLQRERELRTLQSRCEGLERALAQQTQQNEEWGRVLGERGSEAEHAERESNARRRELEAQVDELVQSNETLRAEKQHLEAELHKADDETEQLKQSQDTREQELSHRSAELEAFERELLDQVAKKDEMLETLHEVSQAQLAQLDDKDSELRALSRANSDHMRQLAAKDEALDAAKRELRRRQSEAETVAIENEEQFAKLQALEQRQAERSEQLGDYERLESVLAGKLTALQRKFDHVVAHERELTTEVAALRAEKRETTTTIKRELRKLQMGDDTSAEAEESSSSSSGRRDLVRVFELVQSYQTKQARQDALVRSKEAQVAELSAQVNQLQTARASEPQEEHRESDVDELEREVDRLSHEVARLRVENQRLRVGESDAASRRLVAEWERNYPALKARVQELVEENAQLKAAGSDQHWADEVDALSSLLRRRDAEIEQLRRHEATSRSPHGRTSTAPTNNHHSSSSSPRTTSDAQRMKKLMELVELKEKKILVQNDHMTELMAQAVKLQYEIQCYEAEFGELKLKTRASGTRSTHHPARVS